MSGVPGAYGFRFPGVAGPLLANAPSTWPIVAVRQQIGAGEEPQRYLDDTQAEFPLVDGGSVVVDREPAAGTYRVAAELDPDALAHPYLAPVAAVHAHWHGFETFHAGGFVVDGRAWAVMATREGGKSSLLAALALAGLPIVSDDLIVADQHRVFAGPRSIDLREDAVAHFPASRNLGTVGRRDRWRIDPGEILPEVPLAGWMTIHWNDEFDAHRIEPGDRIRLLAENRTLKAPSPDPHLLLRLAAYPMWAISRPRGWERMGDTVNLVLETAGYSLASSP